MYMAIYKPDQISFFYLFCIVKVENITWNHRFQKSRRTASQNDLKDFYSSVDKTRAIFASL